MNTFERAFYLLPDTVIITDVYWYILNFNQVKPFERLKKGTNLLRHMPDCKVETNDKFNYQGKAFHRRVTPVIEGDVRVGYVVYLADVTEKERLIAQRRRKSDELEMLIHRLSQVNEELKAYVRQAEALRGYDEQLRIARSIHDDAGHAITALNMLSRMCLQLRNTDSARYNKLINDGIAICKRAARKQAARQHSSLAEMLESFCSDKPFPVELFLSGEEPAFALSLCDVVHRVCKEAYHNTLSHSLADRLTIEVRMTPESLALRIIDNGSFHGVFEKGFGLTAMGKSVLDSGGTIFFEAAEGKGFGIVAEWRNGA